MCGPKPPREASEDPNPPSYPVVHSDRQSKRRMGTRRKGPSYAVECMVWWVLRPPLHCTSVGVWDRTNLHGGNDSLFWAGNTTPLWYAISWHTRMTALQWSRGSLRWNGRPDGRSYMPGRGGSGSGMYLAARVWRTGTWPGGGQPIPTRSPRGPPSFASGPRCSPVCPGIDFMFWMRRDHSPRIESPRECLAWSCGGLAIEVSSAAP